MNIADRGLRIAGLLGLLAVQGSAQSPAFTYQKVMIPVRDGVKLETVIMTPANAKTPLPILFRRTPYGVPATANGLADGSLKELARDGYIFVVQNLRGRFGSEGTFELSSKADIENPKATSETTDAYDSIDWLVKHVANNNGKVGMFGVSYDGLTSAMTLLRPHPALKAISEQASPADQWMNDDDHRYGALRESYAFEYAVYEQADKNANTHFDFETYDTYSWYLVARSALEHQREVPARQDSVLELDRRASGLRRVLEGRSVGDAGEGRVRAEPQRRRILGSGRSVGPVGNLPAVRGQRSQPQQLHRRRPVVPRTVAQPEARPSIGQVTFGGHDTALEFREKIEAPWFRYWLHGNGTKFPWKASTFQTGSNSWQTYSAWPPKATATPIYLRANHQLSFDPPPAGDSYVQYISDPANPVPYRARPISPTYPAGDWRRWEVADQRFVDNRPDVATWVSAPLDRDLTVTGELAATLFASTSGTDSDFIVKLIDVYPERAQPDAWNADAGPQPGQYAQSLNGYELPIAMEVRRGRYNASYEHPQPMIANRPTEIAVPLRSHDHVFLKGHRLMVQVQSTWFPLIDRNPQTFVPSIYAAKAEDFVTATQRIYTSSDRPSRLVLPVIR